MKAPSKYKLKSNVFKKRASYIIEKIPNVQDELAETGHERASSEG